MLDEDEDEMLQIIVHREIEVVDDENEVLVQIDVQQLLIEVEVEAPENITQDEYDELDVNEQQQLGILLMVVIEQKALLDEMFVELAQLIELNIVYTNSQLIEHLLQ